MNLKYHIATITQKKQGSILSASLVLAVTFGLSAILGFLRSRFLYSRFFSCCVTDLDAYNAAFRIPDLIFKLLVTGSLSASFIPVFTSYLHKDEKLAYKISSTVINLLIIIFSLASLVVIIFTRPFSHIIAGGFNPAQLNLMSNLTRILLIAQIFFLISNFITGILQVHQTFLVPAFSPIIYNIFIILSIFTLSPIFGIYGVVYGTVVGAFFHLAIQIPVARRIGFRYSFSIDPSLKGVKEIVKMMIPTSLSLGLGEIENTVTLFFASTLPAGSISLLNLAIQLMYLPSRIFGTTVGQASLPVLSKSVARNELENYRNTVVKTILQSLFIAFPITAVILVHRVAIVRIAFGAKQFPWFATLLTARTLACLVPAIATQAIIQIMIRSFYALHDTKTPLKISLISLVTTVGSSYYFVNFTRLGILGLALADSIGNIAQCIGLMYFFIKRVDGFDWSKIFQRALKIILTSVMMGIITWLTLHFFDIFVLDTTKTLNLIILFACSSFIGVISYFYFSRIFRVEEYLDYEKHFLKLKHFISR